MCEAESPLLNPATTLSMALVTTGDRAIGLDMRGGVITAATGATCPVPMAGK